MQPDPPGVTIIPVHVVWRGLQPGVVTPSGMNWVGGTQGYGSSQEDLYKLGYGGWKIGAWGWADWGCICLEDRL